MQRRNDAQRRLHIKSWRQLKPTRAVVPNHIAGWLVIVTALSALSCSCALLGIGSSSPVALVATRTPWPTFTPTDTPTTEPVARFQAPTDSPSAPTATPSPLPQTTSPPPTDAYLQSTTIPDDVPTSATMPTPTFVPTPAVAPTATPTSTPLPAMTTAVDSPGWSLDSVRVHSDVFEEGLLLYGDLINDTGSPQALALVTGTFYDSQGKVIADRESVYDYWPLLDVVPPGGRVPFELVVENIRDAANFILNVEFEPSSESPRQDFEFFDLNQWNEEEAYCVEGILRGPGENLQSYVVVAVVLYDDQESVVNFGDYYKPYLAGDQTLSFEICVGPPNQDIARYELRAWGL